MTMPLVKKSRRPWWIAPFGEEGFGDVFMDRLLPEWNRWRGQEWVPSFDFYEKEGAYFLKAEIPGASKDQISATVENSVVTVSGRKESKREEEGANYYLQESTFGSFSRSLRLPGDVEEGKVEANFKDGVLTLKMPQKKAPEAKKIKIE